MKLNDIIHPLERVAKEAASGVVGKIGWFVVIPFTKTVIKYEFLWRNPDASDKALKMRMHQENEILWAKINPRRPIEIRDIMRGIREYGYFNSNRRFARYIEALMRRMIIHGATAEEVAAIAEMCHEYGCNRKDTISINNLKWIHKMENKYGVEEDSDDA